MKGALRPPELMSGPFTTRTAAAHGVTPHALRRESWRQLFRGVWIAAERVLTRETWLAAARLVLPVDAVLCLLSAVDCYGVDVRREDDVVVHAAFDHTTPRKRSGVQLRELSLAAEEVVTLGRWLVTTPLRTAFDCARLLPFVEAVVVVDALTHAELVTLEELLAFAAAHPGIRWVRRVAEVVALANPLAESPMETRLRLLLVQAGLTGLEPQYVVRTTSGRFVARLDVAFPEARVAVEYDGAWHWKQRRKDDRRRDSVRALDWTVLVFSADEYYRDPAGVIAKVRHALVAAAA